jgi:hypothetical protein
MIFRYLLTAFLLFLFLGTHTSCKKDEETSPTSTFQNPKGPEVFIDPGNDPNFTIVSNNISFFDDYNRKVVVFGVSIYAVEDVDDNNLLHVANVVAQFIDNNEDTEPDYPKIQESLKKLGSFITIGKSPSDFKDADLSGFVGYNLLEEEIHSQFVSNGRQGQFDKSLEVASKLLYSNGYSKVLPTSFAPLVGSEISRAVDQARGGRFSTIPTEYPEHAWYTNYTQSCDYECQVTDYFYWALTSHLGAQEFRGSEVVSEWKRYTPQLFSKDDKGYQLITYSGFKFPSVLPDGSYKQ